MAFKSRIIENNQDYKTLSSKLVDSGLQKDNPVLFQVMQSIIEGLSVSQKFTNEKFNKGDKLSSSLLEGMVPIENGGAFAEQYIPVKTLGLNVLSLGSNEFYYYRIGNLVTVFGYLTINTIAAGADTTGWISLPIISNFAHFWECIGMGYSDTVNQGVTFQADPTNVFPLNKQAKLRFLSMVVGQFDYFINFSYRVLPE